MDKNQAPAPTEGAAALSSQFTVSGRARQTGYRRGVPPQKASKSQPKADVTEKAKSADRTWLTTAELATKIGWREHALRDAMRGKDLPGVRRTSFGYHIEAASVDQIKSALGEPPAKPNSSLKR
jgi:hypothetical protein